MRLFPSLLGRPALLAALLLTGCGPDDPAPPDPLPASPDTATAAFPTPPSITGDLAVIDDASEDPSFQRFRERLRGIIAQRDTAALLEVVAPTARVSFGSQAGGPSSFRHLWFTGEPPGGRSVWQLLGGVLDGGSVWEGDAFTAPFVYTLWPDSIDARRNVAVVRSRVPVRASPSDTAAVVATVGRIFLPVPDEASAPDGWHAIRVPAPVDAVGFVPAEAAFTPTGYRAGFWPDDSGRYRLQFFLTGD